MTPSLLFLDPAVVGDRPLPTVRSLCRHYRGVRFVVCGFVDGSEEANYLRIGIRGYLRVDATGPMIKKVVQAVRRGELWISRRTVTLFLTELGFIHAAAETYHSSPGRLSARELQVARLVMTGASNKEIAKALQITERTVKAHLSHIFAKLGISHRVELFGIQDELFAPGACLENETGREVQAEDTTKGQSAKPLM